MTRFHDDKQMFEKSRDQLRYDIREFEKLSQDLATHATQESLTLRQDLSQQLDRQAQQIETLSFDQGIAKNFIKGQKDHL